MGAPHLLPCILAIRVHVFPSDPEGKHRLSFILTASAKHGLLLVMVLTTDLIYFQSPVGVPTTMDPIPIFVFNQYLSSVWFLGYSLL